CCASGWPASAAARSTVWAGRRRGRKQTKSLQSTSSSVCSASSVTVSICSSALTCCTISSRWARCDGLSIRPPLVLLSQWLTSCLYDPKSDHIRLAHRFPPPARRGRDRVGVERLPEGGGCVPPFPPFPPWGGRSGTQRHRGVPMSCGPI